MTPGDEDVDQGAIADEWAAALEQQAEVDDAMGEGDAEVEAAGEALAAENIDLDEFEETPPGNDVGDNPDLDVILDIPVSISMEVGSTSITIRNLLQLNQGSVIELDRLAGEPLNVLVNGTLIAHGEVVVINEKFGIRMTDVISPSERIKKLR
ncbi:flagellar motor switch protein FliN [Exilibacterium tricleocarpae]|uniref:Flagellar motor switch protein FliN n=1 Tax=Exilibacterium tricleocarpae TaxID=2591008 RepID=A0A545U4C2_9GAMM|nr:flagellar motor switch protein FliN [Exilibacterium tricleocarpae]